MPESIIETIAAERGYSATDLSAAHEAFRRKVRLSHPAGKFDKAGVFHLEERCDCCEGLRRPCPARPYSEMHHARSLTHVAQLYDVPVLHIRRLVKAITLSRQVSCTSPHAQRRCCPALGPQGAAERRARSPCPGRPRPSAGEDSARRPQTAPRHLLTVARKARWLPMRTSWLILAAFYLYGDLKTPTGSPTSARPRARRSRRRPGPRNQTPASDPRRPEART